MIETRDNSIGSEENVRKVSDITGMTAATSESSESTSSESNETSETSDSKSTEDSNASDSTELEPIKAKDCVNGTQSCESEEYLFQVIGDDAHFPLNNLMESDGSERELSLRR
uniref:Uncharacterized protein n=1 Tax=Mastacembelus armatus TaxID=205130 RepID=A0A7N8X8R2_9TELE